MRSVWRPQRSGNADSVCLARARTNVRATRRGGAVVLVCLSFFVSTSSCARVSSSNGMQSDQPVIPNAHPACINFTRGNEMSREFYSPGWPGPYPNNTNCTRTISAPEGQIIQLDFRDMFHLEPSPKCENDFLLVRDGKEAYSPVITRVCGDQFPKIINSSGQHLWLRFRSDESIEYQGFKAVYSFHDSPALVRPPACRFEISGPELIISTENITADIVRYALNEKIPLDCTWRIAVTPGREIQVSFKEFALDKPNECDVNFVEILYGPELLLTSKKRYCSSKADSVKLGVDNDVTFRYFAKPSALESGKTKIFAVVTELRPRSSDEECLPEEFDCDDLYCINLSLVCNGNFNCDKQLDEKTGCSADNERSVLDFLTKETNITILTIGCGLLFGMCFSMCWNCVRKLREDCREKEESVRRSQEGGLDAMVPVTPPTMPRVRSRATLDEGGCYVPGSMEMKPVFHSPPPHRNGGVGIVREETIDTDVETLDQECQTLPGSLRRPSRDSGGSGSSTPPPPPPPTRSCPQGPPISPYPEDHRTYRRYQDRPPPPPPPPPPSCDLHRPRTLPKAQSAATVRPPVTGPEDHFDRATPRRYRAEAVIEMGTRPNSLHSAKSAPDVIVKL